VADITVPIGGTIGPTSTSDTYPTHFDTFGFGGLRVVADIAARDAIPAAHRKELMVVIVQQDKKFYWLDGGITNPYWVEIPFGQGISTEATYILLESGDFLLWETGDRSMIEAPGTTVPDQFLFENGGGFALEDGSRLLID